MTKKLSKNSTSIIALILAALAFAACGDQEVKDATDNFGTVLLDSVGDAGSAFKKVAGEMKIVAAK